MLLINWFAVHLIIDYLALMGDSVDISRVSQALAKDGAGPVASIRPSEAIYQDWSSAYVELSGCKKNAWTFSGNEGKARFHIV